MFALHELIHIVLSLIVAWIFYRYARSAWIFVASFLGGFFIDVDHLYDYFRFKSAFSFNFGEFTAGKYFDITHKVILPLHSYELSILLLIIGICLLLFKRSTKKIVAFSLIAFAVSMFLHLIYDQIYYQPKTLTYSIIYRASKDFDHDSLGFKKIYAK